MSSLNVFTIVCISVGLLSVVAAYGQPRAISTPSPECRRKCKTCPKSPVCAPGISLVLDECGCCKMCAKQAGETCNDANKCDHHKTLYCSYTDVDETEGRCVAKKGRSCYSRGKTHLSGESFFIGCKIQCTCIDGALGCAPRCPITITAPSAKDCLHPKIVLKPGKCCEEWVCASKRLNNTTTDMRPSKFMSERRRQFNRPRVFASAKRAQPIAISIRESDRCKIQTTEWSPCSKTCGWGVSERITTNNRACKLKKQIRLCQLRPCQQDYLPPMKPNKRCVRTVKSPRRVRFSFSGCHSKVYVPKYCGQCTDGRCCAPKHTTTRSVKFTCDNGFKFKKSMMVIKSCECNHKCANSENDIFSSYRHLGGDTWQE